jgi:hypothetical protein
MKFRIQIASILFSLFVSSPSFAAIILVDSNGQLTGANDVQIGSGFFNVEFIDSSCNLIFGDCIPANFDFDNLADAQAAAQALLDQVFLDGPLGNFDSDPGLTAGCEGSSICFAIIPVELNLSQGTFFGAFSINNNGARNDVVDQSTFAITGVGSDFALSSFNTFARFTPTQVPAPATAWLLVIGFAYSILKRRKAVIT